MHGSDGKNSTVGGLGGGEIGFETQSKFEIEMLGNQACVKLKSVEVTFFAKPEIHIASNFSRQSCEYGAVLAHEQGHIQILRKFVREYSPKVKQQLVRIAKSVKSSVGPVDKRDIPKVQSQLQQAFMGHIQQYNSAIMPVLSRRQAAHDSPSEYARVAAKCNGWEKRLAKDPVKRRNRTRSYSNR